MIISYCENEVIHSSKRILNNKCLSVHECGVVVVTTVVVVVDVVKRRMWASRKYWTLQMSWTDFGEKNNICPLFFLIIAMETRKAKIHFFFAWKVWFRVSWTFRAKHLSLSSLIWYYVICHFFTCMCVCCVWEREGGEGEAERKRGRKREG